jgi:transcription antitermination factor NusG
MSSSAVKSRWYAVQTRSNFEQCVCQELAEKGVENYCPRFSEIHQWADRKKTVERPLFPGYVFARFMDSNEVRLRVLKTTGTVRLLGASSTIEAIPDYEIDSLRKMLRVGRSWTPHAYLRDGSRVRVRRGALKDAEGILVRRKDETRLVLSISLFCKAVATEVDAADVEVISAGR